MSENALLDEWMVRAAFKGELDAIQNRILRDLVVACLRRADLRFFTAMSAVLEKNHPADEYLVSPEGDERYPRAVVNREGMYGGQVLHTRRVVAIVRLACEGRQYAGLRRDLLIAAALIHDIGKWQPGERSTVKGHEALVEPLTADLVTDRRYQYLLPALWRLCECHGGPWGIREPESADEHLLHDADHLASHRTFGLFDPALEYGR